MSAVSIVLLLCSGCFVAVGLIPCFGWVNWVAIPLSVLAATSGTVGLFTDRDPATQRARGVIAHALAVACGGFLVLLSVVRCALGGGIF